MKKFFLVITSILMTILAAEMGLRLISLIFQYGSETKIIVKHDGGIRILTLGESTTALGGEFSYSNILQQMLDKKYGIRKFEVINKGIAGTNTNRILDILPSTLVQYKPHVVITMMGINDVWGIPADYNPLLVWLTNNFRIAKLIKYSIINFLYSKTANPNKSNEGRYPREFKKELSDFFLYDVNGDKISFKIGKEHEKKGFDCHSDLFSSKHQLFLNYNSTLTKKIRPGSPKSQILSLIDNFIQRYGVEKTVGIIEDIIPDLSERSCFLNDFYMIYENEASKNEKDFLRISAQRIINKEREVSDFVADIIVQTSEESEKWISWALQNRSRSALIMFAHAEKLFKESPKLCESFLRKHLIFSFAQDFYPTFIVYLDALLALGKHGLVEKNLVQLKRISSLAEGWGAFSRLSIHNNRVVEKSGERYLFSLEKTISNYRDIEQKVAEFGSILLPMQYPTLSIGSLDKVLPEYDEQLFIYNNRNFKEALLTHKYDDLFTDRFAGGFGHTTKRGATLIAQAIVKKIEMLYQMERIEN